MGEPVEKERNVSAVHQAIVQDLQFLAGFQLGLNMREVGSAEEIEAVIVSRRKQIAEARAAIPPPSTLNDHSAMLNKARALVVQLDELLHSSGNEAAHRLVHTLAATISPHAEIRESVKFDSPLSDTPDASAVELTPLSERRSLGSMHKRDWQMLADRFGCETTPTYQVELWLLEREDQLRAQAQELATLRTALAVCQKERHEGWSTAVQQARDAGDAAGRLSAVGKLGL